MLLLGRSPVGRRPVGAGSHPVSSGEKRGDAEDIEPGRPSWQRSRCGSVDARQRGAAGRRRRSLGQHLLVDPAVVERLLARLDLADDVLVVEFGPGRGALTLPLARRGVRVVAVERDRRFVAGLQQQLEREGLAARVRLRRGDLRAVPLPREPYRVISNPPFGLTTTLLGRLLDDPDRGPRRADLLLQAEVARKHAAEPPNALRTAAWAPWWRFELGELVPRGAFRPVPATDARWLAVHRRDPAVLPTRLAPAFGDTLRAAWQQPADVRQRRRA
jgi:23S rRNA (adenine-N6)-dimethyltransferase